MLGPRTGRPAGSAPAGNRNGGNIRGPKNDHHLARPAKPLGFVKYAERAALRAEWRSLKGVPNTQSSTVFTSCGLRWLRPGKF